MKNSITRSQDYYSREQPSADETTSYFIRNKRKILAIIAGGLIGGCGGGGNSPEPEGANSTGDDGRAQKMATSVPLSSVPTSAPVEVDGMIGYGWIYFEHPISGYANGPYINPFQANSYNPRDVLSRLGTTEWIIVRASFTYDADKNNDGKIDTNWTSINAGMHMLLHRGVFERGEKILFTPAAAHISESIMTRPGRKFSQEALDTIARESTNEDINNDGVIDYSDITGKKWSSTGDGKSIPGFTSYMESVYVNTGINRGTALKKLIKMQNHTIRKIIAHPSNHDPMLQIETIDGSDILYTLDGSSPIPGKPSTIVGKSPLLLPLQDKRIYFREAIGTGANQVLGRVKSFDLATDWMELSQETQKYNPNGKETPEETSYSYSGKSYIIRSVSNKTSPGYTYPKFLDCQVGTNAKDGCHLGPYIAYNEVHEAKVRELIHAAAQSYISTTVTPPPDTTPPTNPGGAPTAPTHYQNELTNYTTKTNYLGGWYQVQNQWNASGTKDYPVTILGMYATPDGIRQPNITAIANNETERLQFSQSMVGKLKGIIEARYANLPKPTYPENYVIPSNPVTYKGYSYTLMTTMNTTGYSDFPASVKVKYTTPNGAKETPSLPAKDATELAKVQAERISEAKSQIDMSLGLDEYAPYQVVTLTPKRNYGSGSYKTTFTYSGTVGKDYPGYIDVSYKRSDGSTGKWTMEAKSEAERNLFVPQGEAQAKLEIDNYPLRSVNQIIKYNNIPFGSRGGAYTRYEKYNRTGTGYNFPALIWYEYRPSRNATLLDTRNTYGLTEARNSEHQRELASTLEGWVRGQIVAFGPTETTEKYASSIGTRVLGLLISDAHAADTPSSIVVRNNATKLTSLSPYSADVSSLQTYNIGNPTIEFFMKPGFTAASGKSKVNVVGKSEEEVRLKNIKSELGKQIEKILEYLETIGPGYFEVCTGAGTTMAQGGCIKTNSPEILELVSTQRRILDLLNSAMKEQTLTNDQAITLILDSFNSIGLYFDIIGGEKGNDHNPFLTLDYAFVVGNDKNVNLKRNSNLPILSTSNGNIQRGINIQGTQIKGTELGNLLVGFLGGKAGFTFDYVKRNARIANMAIYIENNLSNTLIQPLDLLGHAWNLAGINEQSDSLLYQAGYEYAKQYPTKQITKEDLLTMIKLNYADYTRISGSERVVLDDYKKRFGLK